MNICPCCKRKMPSPKADAAQKALMQDMDRAEKAIAALQAALRWPGESKSFYVAVQDEMDRLYRALGDYSLLWRIYRRNSKAPSYEFSTLPGEANNPSEVAA